MAHLKKFTQQHILHNNKKSLSKFLEVYLLGSSWQNFHLIETFFAVGQILIIANVQILNRKSNHLVTLFSNEIFACNVGSHIALLIFAVARIFDEHPTL